MDHILYDSKTLSSSAVTATLFQEAVGSKTNGYFECNMGTVGQLPDPQSFVIKAISKAFLPDAVLADVIALDLGWCEFSLNNETLIGPLPIFVFPQACGIQVMPDAGSTGTTVPAIGAGASVKNLFVLEKPLTIPSGANFKWEFTWPTAPNAKTFYWLMHGELFR